MADDTGRLGSLIRQLQGALGGKTIKVGTDTVTFTAATNSAAKTVTHGLGTTPVAITAFGIGDTGVLGIFYDCINTPGSTSFDIVGYRPAGAISGTKTFTWIAIG